jgi:hypothetical protein
VKLRLLLLLTVLGLAFLPTGAAAQDGDEEDEGFLLSANNPLTIGADQRIGTAVVINDDATVDGTVTGALVVINGNATVSGTVEEDVTVINGDLDLADGSTINDAFMVNGDVTQAAGATVTGDIEEREDLGFQWGLAGSIASFLFWLATTVVILVAGLLFAAVGGLQLSVSAGNITRRIGPTLLTTVILWIGVPLLAVVAFVTVIGIPLGIGILVFLLPALWFLGYLVSGTALGAAILRAFNRVSGPRHPYVAALLGLFILQIIVLVPFLGWLIALLAGLIGAGALALLAWKAWRGRGAQAEAVAAT